MLIFVPAIAGFDQSEEYRGWLATVHDLLYFALSFKFLERRHCRFYKGCREPFERGSVRWEWDARAYIYTIASFVNPTNHAAHAATLEGFDVGRYMHMSPQRRTFRVYCTVVCT